MLDESVVRTVLQAGLRTGGEFAEIFVEDRRASSARLDDGRVEELSSSRDRGAGIRVVVGDSTGYAHTADLTELGLLAAAEAAAGAARHGDGGVGGARSIELTRAVAPSSHDARVLPEGVAKADKVALLLRADEAARAQSGAVRQVTAVYGDSRRRILVANSDGLLADDDQVKCRFMVQAVAAGDTGLQTGYESTGYTTGFELFDDLDVEEAGPDRGASRRHQTGGSTGAERDAARRPATGWGRGAVP